MAEEATTSSQEDEFGAKFFDDVGAWIGLRLTPGQVFDESDISEWCKNNTDPADVFGTARLEEWARENGWEKVHG